MAYQNNDLRLLGYACIQITVENRDYHYLSQSEIAGAKRISRQLSNYLTCVEP
jgi:hypothetical protein